MNKLFSLLLLSIILFTSCTKDSEDSAIIIPPVDSRVLVSCEGGFNQNNASVSAYDPSTNTSVSGLFNTVNGYGIGDVLQFVTQIEDNIYAVVNGSAKIEVMGLDSLSSLSTITGLSSPREIVHVSGDKAYVSNIFSNYVQILDLQTATVVDSVDIGGWSQGMIVENGKVFVSRTNENQVMVVDIQTDLVIDSITVAAGPLNLVKDMDDKIWLICNGNFGAEEPMVHRINPVSNDVEQSFSIPSPWGYQMAMRINGPADRLYVLNNNVYTMSISDQELNATAIIEDGTSYYGLGISPVTGDIYLGSGDFSSDGTVKRFDSEASLIDEFAVGVAPNGFFFGN